MTNLRFGLRAKASLAMVLAALIALIPAALIGKQVLDGVRNHFGEAYAVNFTKLKRQSILAPVSRELALSRRFANSVLTRKWLLGEHDPAKKSAFFQEAEGYRQSFRDHNYFIASALSRNYYTNEPLAKPPMSRVDVASRALGERENGLFGVIGGGVLCEWHDFPGVGRDCSCKSVA